MKLQKATAVILAIAGLIFLAFAVRVSIGESHSASATTSERFRVVPFEWGRDVSNPWPSNPLAQRSGTYRLKGYYRNAAGTASAIKNDKVMGHLANIHRAIPMVGSSDKLVLNSEPSNTKDVDMTIGGKKVTASMMDELYCADYGVNTPTDSNVNSSTYRKTNLEDSGYFTDSAAARIRSITMNAYPYKKGNNSYVYTKAQALANIEKACKSDPFDNDVCDKISTATDRELLTGAQWAIWEVTNNNSEYCTEANQSLVCEDKRDNETFYAKLCDNDASASSCNTASGETEKLIRSIRNGYKRLPGTPLSSNNVATGIVEFGKVTSEVIVNGDTKTLRVRVPISTVGAKVPNLEKYMKFLIAGKEYKASNVTVIDEQTNLYTFDIPASVATGETVNIKIENAIQEGVVGPFLYKSSGRGNNQYLVGVASNDKLPISDEMSFKVPEPNSTTLEIIKVVKKQVVDDENSEVPDEENTEEENSEEDVEGGEAEVANVDEEDDTVEVEEEMLPGVTIRVTGPNNFKEEFVTEEGKSKIIKIESVGKYIIEEIAAPDGYILSEPIEFEVTPLDLGKDGQGVKFVKKIENDYTKVHISKVDINSQEELPGAKLELYDETGKLIENWVSADTPHMIEKLKPGKYLLKETIAPEGYELSSETVEFEVEATGEIQMVKMNNSREIEVPRTDLDKSLILYLVGGIILLTGSGLIFYYVKRKNKASI